jgi:formate hydrogenlyase subunit 3/multisubunit Na+/H+ antiporter MnhD subunit
MASEDSTAEIVRRLIADLARLLQAYGREARAHARAFGRELTMAAVMIGAAALLGVFALGLAVAALVLVAAVWLPGWLAALIVLLAMALVMAALVALAVRRVRRRRAAWAARVEEEIRWLKSLFPREG